MATVALTDALVRTLPAPPKGNKVYYDAVGPAGLGARVTAAGTRSFIFNYRTRTTGRERRITIGKFPNWSVGAARAEAKRLRRLVDQGEDPLGNLQDARDAPTVADLIARFDAEHVEVRLRPGTALAYRSLISEPHRSVFRCPHESRRRRLCDDRQSAPSDHEGRYPIRGQ